MNYFLISISNLQYTILYIKKNYYFIKLKILFTSQKSESFPLNTDWIFICYHTILIMYMYHTMYHVIHFKNILFDIAYDCIYIPYSKVYE